MKKIIKLFTAAILVFLMTLTLTSCNKVTEKNFDKITAEMTKAAVVEILGEADDSTTIDEYVVMYWFKGAKSVAEAQSKTADGKKVTYIKVVFHDSVVYTTAYGEWELETVK